MEVLSGGVVEMCLGETGVWVLREVSDRRTWKYEGDDVWRDIWPQLPMAQEENVHVLHSSF